MASVRGLLNIQSLNESTHEKLGPGFARAGMRMGSRTARGGAAGHGHGNLLVLLVACRCLSLWFERYNLKTLHVNGASLVSDSTVNG